MIDKEIFTGLAIALQLVAFTVYCAQILKRQVRPHGFSWLLWAVLIGVGGAAQLHEGAGWAALPLFFDVAGCLFFAILSVRFGERQITRGDWIALLAGLAAIPLWLLTRDPLYSVLLVILIDAVGLWPTVRKSWRKPFEESASLFIITGATMSLALAGLRHYTVVAVVYPMTIVAMNFTFAACLLARRYILGGNDKPANML